MRAHEHVGFLYGGIFSQHIETTQRLLHTCADMAESIAILLDTNGTVRTSPYVLERSLGEAIMRLCYLHDSSAPPARTVARMAAYQLEAIEGNLRAAQSFGRAGIPEAKRARENIAEMHGWLTGNGFTRTADRREPFTVSIEIDGHRENLAFNATDAFKRYLPKSAWQWEIGSGVTHSRGWMLSGMIATTESESLTSFLDVALGIGASVLELADVLAHAIAGHTGADVEWYTKKTHARRRGITSWTEGHQDIAVGHTEYASRGVEWQKSERIMSETFRGPNR